MPLFTQDIIRTLSVAAENAINTALAMDPKARKKLTSLEACVLEIQIRSPQLSVFFASESGKLKLLSRETVQEKYAQQQQPEVVLKGSVMAFVKLATLDDAALLFRTKELELSGDAVRAQQIQMFVRSINIDWEALMAEVVGDVPAHFIGSAFKNSLQWGRIIGSAFLRDAEDYLKYELSLLPGKQQGAAQFQAIDQIRLQTDRLEARLKKLIGLKETH